MLVYRCEDLIPIGYTDSDFQSDLDFRKSTSGCVFTLEGGAITWKSVKQSCIADSTMEAGYVAACEAAKDAVWLKKFLSDLGVVRIKQVPITLFCDNSGVVAQSKDPRNHKEITLRESTTSFKTLLLMEMSWLQRLKGQII